MGSQAVHHSWSPCRVALNKHVQAMMQAAANSLHTVESFFKGPWVQFSKITRWAYETRGMTSAQLTASIPIFVLQEGETPDDCIMFWSKMPSLSVLYFHGLSLCFSLYLVWALFLPAASKERGRKCTAPEFLHPPKCETVDGLMQNEYSTLSKSRPFMQRENVVPLRCRKRRAE